MFRCLNSVPKSKLASPFLFQKESQGSGFFLINKRFKKRKPALTVKLTTYVENLGQENEIVKVRPGYMRNDLYPNGLAQYVLKERKQFHRAQLELTKSTEGTQEKTESSKQSFAQYMKLARMDRELKKLGSVTFTRAVISGGQVLYGSVTSEDLIRLLRDDHYLILDKDLVSMDKIKKLGSYVAKINLEKLGVLELSINVVSDIPIPEIDTTSTTTSLNA